MTIPRPQQVGNPAISPPYRFKIIVFTYNRLEGLRRLLFSLKAADYLGYRSVTLHVFMDFPKKPDVPLDGSREFLDAFEWPHGEYVIHRRLVNVGLKKSILESWYPVHSDDEVAAFFEDDIEVSPVWFVWVDRGLRKYLFNASRGPADAKLLGLSLFRPVKDELSGAMVEGVLESTHGQPFALQQPCSWGAVYFPKPWREFRNWYDRHVGEPSELRDPRDDTIRPSSNAWDSSSSWKKFLIKLMYERGWFMIYPNFPERRVLSTNHLMPGVHPTPPRKLFELPLVPQQDRLSEAERRCLTAFPEIDELHAFNVMFRPVGHITQLPNYNVP